MIRCFAVAVDVDIRLGPDLIKERDRAIENGGFHLYPAVVGRRDHAIVATQVALFVDVDAEIFDRQRFENVFFACPSHHRADAPF